MGTIDLGYLGQLKGFMNESPSVELFNDVVAQLAKYNILQEDQVRKSKKSKEFYKSCCVQRYNVD